MFLWKPWLRSKPSPLYDSDIVNDEMKSFEVESALLEHPVVVECAINAVPDEIRG